MFQKKRVSLVLPEAYPSGSSQFITSHTFPTGEKNEDPGNEMFFDSICLIVTYVFARLNFHDFQNISCVLARLPSKKSNCLCANPPDLGTG